MSMHCKRGESCDLISQLCNIMLLYGRMTMQGTDESEAGGCCVTAEERQEVSYASFLREANGICILIVRPFGRWTHQVPYTKSDLLI